MGSTRTKWEGRMEEMRGRLKESWGTLTDDDFDKAEGKWDRLVGAIKEKTGETAENIERKLDELFDKDEPRS